MFMSEIVLERYHELITLVQSMSPGGPSLFRQHFAPTFHQQIQTLCFNARPSVPSMRLKQLGIREEQPSLC